MYRLLSVLMFLCILTSTASGHGPAIAGEDGRSARVAVVPVDLNGATAEQLEALPGVGPALAERIIAYRDEHGPFTRVEQLGDVRGIGPRTLERLRSCVVVE